MGGCGPPTSADERPAKRTKTSEPLPVLSAALLAASSSRIRGYWNAMPDTVIRRFIAHVGRHPLDILPLTLLGPRWAGHTEPYLRGATAQATDDPLRLSLRHPQLAELAWTAGLLSPWAALCCALRLDNRHLLMLVAKMHYPAAPVALPPTATLSDIVALAEWLVCRMAFPPVVAQGLARHFILPLRVIRSWISVLDKARAVEPFRYGATRRLLVSRMRASSL
jgi:hypothetical protein